MHVLGAPPAFVLSQDQTLCKLVSEHPSGWSDLQIAQPGKVPFAGFRFKKISRVFVRFGSFSGTFAFPLSLFIFQGAVPDLRSRLFCRPSRRDLHSTTFSRNCQPLFSVFFRYFLTKFFSTTFHRRKPPKCSGFSTFSTIRLWKKYFFSRPLEFFLRKGLHFGKTCAMIKSADFILKRKSKYAPVAQLDRALDSDSKGRRFDSCRAYHSKSLETITSGLFSFRFII